MNEAAEQAFESWWQNWRAANGYPNTERMRDAARAVYESLAFSNIDMAVQQLRDKGHLEPQATRPEEVQKNLPSGWMAVPVKATIQMHNAAALGGIYEEPSFRVEADGRLYLRSSCPDWSRVWAAMIEAAPSLPSPQREKNP